MNARVGGYVVDAYFPSTNSSSSSTAHEYHDNPVNFEGDRDRDADTLERGIATVRVTPERIAKNPRNEAERLNRILEQRRNLGR